MTPSERAARAMKDLADHLGPPGNDEAEAFVAVIAAAIQEAEDEALERAAKLVASWSHPTIHPVWHQNLAAAVRSLKTPRKEPAGE